MREDPLVTGIRERPRWRRKKSKARISERAGLVKIQARRTSRVVIAAIPASPAVRRFSRHAGRDHAACRERVTVRNFSLTCRVR